MIIGIGTDIVSVPRIRDAITRFGHRFSQRILTASEHKHYLAASQPENFLAKRFAAKEAAVKALGTGMRGIGFHDIEVTHNHLGKPSLLFSNKVTLDKLDCQLSISDEKAYAVAFVVLQQMNEPANEHDR